MIDEFNRLVFAPYEFSFFRTKNGSPEIANYYLEFGSKFIDKLNNISNTHLFQFITLKNLANYNAGLFYNT